MRVKTSRYEEENNRNEDEDIVEVEGKSKGEEQGIKVRVKNRV